MITDNILKEIWSNFIKNNDKDFLSKHTIKFYKTINSTIYKSKNDIESELNDILEGFDIEDIIDKCFIHIYSRKFYVFYYDEYPLFVWDIELKPFYE